MAMTTGNEDEVKVEDDEVKTEKTTKATVTAAKREEPKTEPKPEPKVEVKVAPKKVRTPDQEAIVFLAQRALDQSGFEDFKALYPSLFE